MLNAIYNRLLLVWTVVNGLPRRLDDLKSSQARMEADLDALSRQITRLADAVEIIREQVVPQPVAAIILEAGPVEEQVL